MSLFRKTATAFEQDRQLAKRLLAGDERALQAFMEEYFPRLYRFAYVRLRNDHAGAEDVVQQTLTIAARRIETYRGEASLMSWLATICTRELVRWQNRNDLREQSVTLFNDEPLMNALLETLAAPAESEPVNLSERAELISLVHHVMDSLPNRYGDVLEWKYIEGLSAREIGARLALGEEASQSLVARAKRCFREAFQEIYSVHYGGDRI